MQFLEALAANNRREWFNEHKETYLQAQQNMQSFVEELMAAMNQHDVLEDVSAKKCLYRIYNDVRFSKDKSPYNPHFAFGFRRATKLRRGGYYVNVQPNNTFLACGFFAPNPEDLKRIRLDIDQNYDQWHTLLSLPEIKTNFGMLEGSKVLSAPRGFNIDHPAIDLLRYKQLIFKHKFDDNEVTQPNFGQEVNRILKAVRPFFDRMSEILTTDLNGELVV
jgi:uncharacterized protein (TIGR02453 family)